MLVVLRHSIIRHNRLGERVMMERMFRLVIYAPWSISKSDMRVHKLSIGELMVFAQQHRRNEIFHCLLLFQPLNHE